MEASEYRVEQTKVTGLRVFLVLGTWCIWYGGLLDVLGMAIFLMYLVRGSL